MCADSRSPLSGTSTQYHFWALDTCVLVLQFSSYMY